MNKTRYLAGIRPSLEGEPQVEAGADVVEEELDEVVTELVLDEVQAPSNAVRLLAITISRTKIARPQISHAVVSQGSHSQR